MDPEGRVAACSRGSTQQIERFSEDLDAPVLIFPGNLGAAQMVILAGWSLENQ